MTFPNMSDLLEKAKSFEAEMKKSQEKMERLTVEGESGAGLVKIKLNGHGECLSVSIDPKVFSDAETEAMSPGEIIEELVMGAFNDAAKKLETQKKDVMAQGMPAMPFNMEGLFKS
jgi:DNA-binding YbaB/EbfC family protein